MNLYDIAIAKKLSGGGGPEPSGTTNINANGMYDVKSFASASVSVPVGVFPSGTSSITANGIYDITNFASVDVNVSGGGGGGTDAEDGIIDRTISGAYTNSRVTIIGSYAFAQCKSLTAVDFPNVTSTSQQAFYSCTSLNTLSFPKLKVIDTQTFAGCNMLTAGNFPEASNIGYSAFEGCAKLATLSFPKASTIGNYAFYDCSSITTASFPQCGYIGTQAFRWCNKLTSLYILASSVATLNNVNAFNGTPISGTGAGTIYVPASLVDSYKTATNWSAYASHITSYTG